MSEEDEWRRIRTWNMWYRTYKMGDSWRASETNAHPHISDDGNVVAVHNGIIENYQELKDKLIRKGYSFYSATDTEVAVN